MNNPAVQVGDKFGPFELVAIQERPMGTLYTFHGEGQSFTIRWPARRSALCAADLAFILPSETLSTHGVGAGPFVAKHRE